MTNAVQLAMIMETILISSLNYSDGERNALKILYLSQIAFSKICPTQFTAVQTMLPLLDRRDSVFKQIIKHEAPLVKVR